MGRGQGTLPERAPARRDLGLPLTLFHTSPAAQLPGGLRPGLTSVYENLTAPRRDCVYLSTDARVACWYERHLREDGIEPTTYAIDRTSLDASLLLADEDAFLNHPSCLVDPRSGLHCPVTNHIPEGAVMAWQHFALDRPPPRGRPGETLAEWAARNPLDRPNLLRYAISRGSVAYRGQVDADHLRQLSAHERADIDGSGATIGWDTPAPRG